MDVAIVLVRRRRSYKKVLTLLWVSLEMVSEQGQVVTTANTTLFVVMLFGKDRRALPRIVWLRVCFDRVMSYFVRVNRSGNEGNFVE